MSQRIGQRGRCMPVLDKVMLRFFTAGIPRETPRVPEWLEPRRPTRDQLVNVRLMPNVPDEPVGGRVENAVQGEGELDNPEVRREMPPGLGHLVTDEGADLAAELCELLRSQPTQVGTG